MANKILLVEDDPNFRTVLALALELQGYSVRQADCGQNALERLRSDRPDMIISDLEMSGMDGRALCKHARGDSKFRDIPFIILSAFIDPDEPSSLPDLPANCCLSKQVSISQLVHRIEELLGNSQKMPRSNGDGQPGRVAPRD